MYDARKHVKLHDSAETCDKVDQGDFAGVDDVAFLEDGGAAMACNQLLLYKGAADTYETLEPRGTQVFQVAVSYGSRGFGQRLFWTSGFDANQVTKSRAV